MKRVSLRSFPAEVRKDIREAMRFYREVNWGKDPEGLKGVRLPRPRTMVKVGHLVALVYLSDKGGDVDLYVHAFKPPFPILAASRRPDQLWIVGGGYRIQEEGIVH